MNNVNQILDNIVIKLVEEFQPGQIYLYGSYAWGLPNSDSDLDILVLIENSNESKIERGQRAYRAIRGLNKIPVDLMVRTYDEFNYFTDVTSTLNYKIASEGKIIYESPKF